MDKTNTSLLVALVAIISFTAGITVEDYRDASTQFVENDSAQKTQAYFTWAPLPPKSGEDVQFEDISVGDAKIVKWNWVFRVGNTDNILMSTEQNPTQTAPEVTGLFSVLFTKLTVTDEYGETSSWTEWIEVGKTKVVPEM